MTPREETVPSRIGVFELLVLMAVSAHRDQAYGVAIRRAVAAGRGTDVSSGAVYTTLERLETRGFVISRRGDPSEVRGGRPRRYYCLTPSGESAVRTNVSAVTLMAGRTPAKLLRS